MITLRIHLDETDDPDDDEDGLYTRVYNADDKEHSTILHPPGVPREDGVEFHMLLVPGGQVAVYEGLMVAWHGVDHLTGMLDTVAWASML